VAPLDVQLPRGAEAPRLIPPSPANLALPPKPVTDPEPVVRPPLRPLTENSYAAKSSGQVAREIQPFPCSQITSVGFAARKSQASEARNTGAFQEGSYLQ
jgi:hypothetical protein